MTKLAAKWRRGSFMAMIGDVRQKRHGHLNGPFGIDRRLRKPTTYILTHIPTGWRIGGFFKSYKSARDCAEKIAPLLNFELIKTAPIKKLSKKQERVVKILREFSIYPT